MPESGTLRTNAYFIADLHLDPDHQDTLQFSLTFFEQVRKAHSLYILGDLFEYWIGDDAGIVLYQNVIDALAAVSAAGCQVTVMLGNRDFLLGDTFALATGACLVREDELLIELGNEPVLLMHGDTLCIDDIEYQHFRAQMRNSAWQQQFLSKSIDERLRYAEHLRQQSREKSAEKPAELMDVNAQQVLSTMAAQPCSVLIHGHTHRPDDHSLDAHGSRRLVLGDWHADHAQYVVKDDTGLHLKNFCGQLYTPAPSV